MSGDPSPPEDSRPDANEPRLDGPYWEGCYQRGETRWEKGAPSPGLVDFLADHPGLARGSVLVPGCGTGHDVLCWAKAGFDTTAMDIAPSAVRLTSERIRREGVGARFLVADFLREPASDRFDWVWEHTLFCAIAPGDRDLYGEAVRRWLRPGGAYLAVNYLHGEPGGPPFTTTREELQRRFEPWFELVDSWVPRSYPNRAGLERMFWWRARA